MIKHGISHSALALTAVMAGEILSNKVLDYWPAIEYELATKIQPYLSRHNWHFDTHHLGILITISLFGFVWGATFKSMNE